MGDAMGKRHGLAGAGSGNDEERRTGCAVAGAVPDGATLAVIQRRRQPLPHSLRILQASPGRIHVLLLFARWTALREANTSGPWPRRDSWRTRNSALSRRFYLSCCE